MNALKGKGKKGKGKGKWGKGYKGKWNGGGKVGKGYNYYNSYQRSSGKGVGKGLNVFDNDYWDAWGEEPQSWQGDDNNWYNDWSYGNGMDVMMMFERGCEREGDDKEENEKNLKTMTKATGERDPLRNIERAKPIALHNKYEKLLEDLDNEDDDEEEEIADTDIGTSESEADTCARKHKPNKRQRLRRRQLHAAHGNSTACYKDAQLDQLHDEEVRDAAALENVSEADWQAIRNETECSGVQHNVRRAQQVHTNNLHNHLQTHTQPLQTTNHICPHARNGSSSVPQDTPTYTTIGKGLPELACINGPRIANEGGAAMAGITRPNGNISQQSRYQACLCNNGRAAAGGVTGGVGHGIGRRLLAKGSQNSTYSGECMALVGGVEHAIGRRLLAKGSQSSTGARCVTFQDDTNCQNRKCGHGCEDHDHNHDDYTNTTTTQPRILHDHHCSHNAHNHNGSSCVLLDAQHNHNHNNMHNAHNYPGSSRVLLGTRFNCHQESIDLHSSSVDYHHKVNDVQSARTRVASSGLSAELLPTDERVLHEQQVCGMKTWEVMSPWSTDPRHQN